MRVAVHDSGLSVRWAVGLQPLGKLSDRQRSGCVPIVAIAFEQPQELRNLALQKGTRPLELRERAPLPCDVAQLRQAGRIGQPDLMTHAGITDIRLVDLAARVEAVDL